MTRKPEVTELRPGLPTNRQASGEFWSPLYHFPTNGVFIGSYQQGRNPAWAHEASRLAALVGWRKCFIGRVQGGECGENKCWCARSIKPSEGSRSRLRRTRWVYGNCMWRRRDAA